MERNNKNIIYRIDAYIKSHIESDEQDFQFWREYIFNYTIFSAVVIGLIAFIPTVYLAYYESQIYVVGIYITGYIWICLNFFSHVISFRIKALLTAFIFYCVGLVLILFSRHYQTGMIWLFIFPIVSSLLFSVKITVISFFINLTTLLLIGFSIHHKLIDIPCAYNTWLINTLNFLVINAITSLSISLLINSLKKLIHKENEARKHLADEHARLITANTSLQHEIAEKQAMQENLILEENRYRSVFENTGTATFLLDKNLIVSMMNSEAERLSGYSKSDAEGKLPFSRFISDPDLEKIRHHRASLKSKDQPSPLYEFDFIDRDRNIKSVSARISMITDTSNAIVSLHDITDIKQIRDTLKKKEELLTIALETTSDGIWDWFPQSGQTFFSSRFYTMLGYNPYELPQNYETWLNLIHPDDRDPVIESINSQLDDDADSFSIEFRSVTKNGELKWIAGKGTVVDRSPDRTPLRIVGTHVDITEQKQILDSLLNSEKKYRTLYNNALIGMFSFRRSDSSTITINEYACKMLGYSDPEEVIGRDIISGYYFSDEQKVEMSRQLLSEKEIYSNELQIKRKDGSPFWIILSMKLYESEDQIDCYFIDITRRKKAEEQLHNLMFYDQLTRLPNKEMFINRLAIEIVRAHRRSQVFSVISIGLDNFKKINDMHGTKIGDKILIEIGNIFNNTFRKDDLIARISGDHFMVLLSDIGSTDDVMDIVKKIREVLNEPFIINNTIIKLTASMGIALYPHDGDSGELLIKNSESAMFMAKESGKNSYIMYDQKMHDQVLKYFEIEEELRRAIDNDEFIAYYQPKVDSTGTLLGMETLIRWNSPRLGFVSPAEFIPIAERSGLIAEIGDIILQKACIQNKTWQHRGFMPLKVSVNLSPYQFRSAELIYKIRTALDISRLEARYLELEITESGIMENEKESIMRLNDLHSMGISISIDDFGTGYSSLSKLKLYPIDTLKIDKSFIDDLPHEASSVSITTAIIDLAYNLGFNVIAEGVETGEQVNFLVSKGCNAFQGYFFHRPMPGEEFEKLFLK
ncbi:MAG TPA: EAL domain-containing protein [Spirochaetota bacterium]|mgnify:FL=1|nr:EAL domain-containing protein [Spirochaetota bacterium]HPI90841.1 EAL domain-containing protein [Spirochaetota bacterium]HPR49868.1 EAL domain-containing protein [Spirochaetota bacterium]